MGPVCRGLNYSDPFGLRACDPPDTACLEGGLTGAQAAEVFKELARMAPAINREVVLFIPKNLAAAASGELAAGAQIARFAQPGSKIGRLLGRPNPVKPNGHGQLQPYSAANGRYLPNGANPGLAGSPLAEMAGGALEGAASQATGGAVDPPTAITRFRQAGQAIGKVAWEVWSLINK